MAGAAAEAIKRNPDLWAVNPARLLTWALDADLPVQSWDSDFGDPTITVARNSFFRIDLLYWSHNATPTHKHVSCGAFVPLHGPRLHQAFRFTPSGGGEVDPYLRTGDLDITSRSVMGIGEIHEIHPELIHDLFWLSHPSVTLSIRCNGHPGPIEEPWEYWDPGLAVLDMCHHATAEVSRRTAALRLLRRASPRTYRSAVGETMRKGRPVLAYHAVVDLLATDPDGELLFVLETLADRKDPVGEALLAATPHIARKTALHRVRTNDPETQLVVALLWSGMDAQAIELFLQSQTVRDVPSVMDGAAEAIDTLDRVAAEALRTVASAPRTSLP
jgi:hypothetical protein